MAAVELSDVQAAQDRITDDDVVRRTPIERSRSLSRMADADVHLKMEHLQRTGSFKTRGAYNKLLLLADRGEAERVIAASAGNHAQGVALAATETGIDSTIVMPQNAPQTKVDATRSYGAKVVLHGGTFGEAMAHARELAGEPGVEFVHAYDDPVVVAGQGTIGIETHEQLSGIDVIVVPIGGGGLVGGIGAALAGLARDVRIVGVQAENATTVPQSLQQGQPVSADFTDTIADGIATGGISKLTFELIREHVDEVVVVSDDEIANSSLILFERAKQVVEGAGAASVAALLNDDLDLRGETVVPVLSGGNVDMSMLQTMLTYALKARDQLLRLRVHIDDVPGEMSRISGIIAERGANIKRVRHDRAVGDLDVGDAYLVFEVVTEGGKHAQSVVEAIEAANYSVTRVN